ncbi:MAG: hypothetical protein V4515_00335 [Chloroflexota bacterium]
MTPTTRHLRPLLISILALLLTAGIAYAGKPTSVGSGRITAAQAAARTLPAAPDTTGAGRDDVTESAGGSGDHCLVDLGTATPEALAALTHGAIVCSAAHQATPEAYKNHGAYVAEWARRNHGVDAGSGAEPSQAARGTGTGTAGRGTGADHGTGAAAHGTVADHGPAGSPGHP